MVLSLLSALCSAEVYETALGPVDAEIQGEGPTVLVFHGAPGGSDQGAMLSELQTQGFQVVAISRPGYLETPLSSGPDFNAQGDLAAALLDVLGIPSAAALGLSAGGPAALAFATRHPERAWALVLEAAVVDAYVPADMAENSRLGRLILSPVLGGPTFALLRRSMLRRPARSAEQLLEIESHLDGPERAECAEQIAQEPERWAALANSMVPFRKRRRGLRNDLDQLALVSAESWASLSVPTLLQYSPSDADVPISHSQALLELGVDAELHVVEQGCGHLLWFGEAGVEVAERRGSFLHEHAP